MEGNRAGSPTRKRAKPPKTEANTKHFFAFFMLHSNTETTLHNNLQQFGNKHYVIKTNKERK